MHALRRPGQQRGLKHGRGAHAAANYLAVGQALLTLLGAGSGAAARGQ